MKGQGWYKTDLESHIRLTLVRTAFSATPRRLSSVSSFINFFNMSSSWFSCVELGPPIEVFALNKAYLDDNHAKKVNLGVGGKEGLSMAYGN